MAKVIVIGAGGQVAADLVPKLCERGDELTLVDRMPVEGTHVEDILERCLHGRPEWRSWWRVLDATRQTPVDELIREIRPDEIYHLAAILSARCEDDPADCWTKNMALFDNVIESVRKLTLEGTRIKLIWPSSIAAFGPPPEHSGPYIAQNEYPFEPQTMYGVTKVACEVLGTYYSDKYGVDFRSVRFPGLINTAKPGGGSSDYANAMYFGAANGTKSAVSFVSAETRMPFMYMDDAVEALLQLAASDASRLTRRVYNITAFPAPSAAEIAASIAREVPEFEVSYAPDERQGYVDSWPDDFDDQPARRDWGWQPTVATLDEMTRRLLADFKASEPQPQAV